MNTLITKDVKISAETFFRPEYSQPTASKYVFSYQITIHNLGNTPVQLLRRHWFIFDSVGAKHEVEGEGVIGQQPILEPGEFHQYQSWSQLTTELGNMKGSYLMLDLKRNLQFQVWIPSFQLIAPFKMN
ncbi:MAG: Co2+/Mg2+ efflux protein ApaG [Saprospiraceae bacterium]|nr:Co2+/Mg2+ efflux protein ApaG [Saprospiraceae bacterium]